MPADWGSSRDLACEEQGDVVTRPSRGVVERIVEPAEPKSEALIEGDRRKVDVLRLQPETSRPGGAGACFEAVYERGPNLPPPVLRGDVKVPDNGAAVPGLQLTRDEARQLTAAFRNAGP